MGRVKSTILSLVTLGVICCLSFPTYSQDILIKKTFPEYSGGEIVSQTITPNGTLFFIGNLLTDKIETRKGFLIQTNDQLEPILKKELGNPDEEIILFDIIPTTNSLWVGANITRYHTSHIRLYNLDMNGKINSVVDLSNSKMLYGKSLLLSDETILVGGFVLGETVESKNSILMACNSRGNLIWQKEYEISGEDEISCMSTNLQGLLLLAIAKRDPENLKGSSSILLCNRQGEIIREISSPFTDIEYITNILFYKPDLALINGRITRRGLYSLDGWLGGFDFSKEKFNWNMTTSLKGEDYITHIITALDNSFYIIGNQKSSTNHSTTFLWNINSNGKILKQKELPFYKSAQLKRILQLPNGKFVASGSIGKQKSMPLAVLLTGMNINEEFNKFDIATIFSNSIGDPTVMPVDTGKLIVRVYNNSKINLPDGNLTIFLPPKLHINQKDTLNLPVTLAPMDTLTKTYQLVSEKIPADEPLTFTFLLTGYHKQVIDRKKIQLHAENTNLIKLDLGNFNFSIKERLYPISGDRLLPGDDFLLNFSIRNLSPTTVRNLTIDIQSPNPKIKILSSRTLNHPYIRGYDTATFQIHGKIDESFVVTDTLQIKLKIGYRFQKAPQLFYIPLKVSAIPSEILASTAKSDSTRELNRNMFTDTLANVKIEKKESVEKESTPVVSPVDINIPQTPYININAYAVIIGNSDYVKAPRVDYAIRDAQLIKKYFVNAVGIPEANIFYLTNATKADFETYFGIKGKPEGRLYNSIIPDVSDVFIYYSGHGAPGLKDKQGYFVPVDCDPQYLEITGYSLDTFFENLTLLPAKNICVILDACFSGANIYKNISPLLPIVKDYTLIRKELVVLSSSHKNQVSSWYPKYQHGLFTYFFAYGLQEGRADGNNDGIITVKELYDFLANPVKGVPYYARKLHGVEQVPELKGLNKNLKLFQK